MGEDALKVEAAQQDKKLMSAAHTLQRTRAQLRQLTDQLESRESFSGKFDAQIDALHRLLIEKERRLMDALVEASSALEEKQPQEAPQTTKAEKGEQLLQLA